MRLAVNQWGKVEPAEKPSFEAKVGHLSSHLLIRATSAPSAGHIPPLTPP